MVPLKLGHCSTRPFGAPLIQLVFITEQPSNLTDETPHTVDIETIRTTVYRKLSGAPFTNMD